MEAGGDHVWVARCSSDVLASELAVDDLAVAVLVEYRESSVLRGYRASVNVDGSLQVGGVVDGNWDQVEVVSHPRLVGSAFLRTNDGVGQTGSEKGCNEARQ